MKNIGKYNGIPCYECSDREYKNCLSGDQDNGNQIFIVDGTMIRRNRIIGYYDGKHVRDIYDNVPYVVRHEPGPQKEMKVDTPVVSVSTGGPMTQKTEEIVYSDYSKVVDDFFANLSDPTI